ncbi:MAG: DMT family transporter [Pseudomonadota bacterium]
MAKAVTLSPSLRGIVAMSFAAVILTIHDTGTKLLLEHYSIVQLVTVRQAFSLVLLMFIVQFTVGWTALRIVNRTAVGVRMLLFISTTVLIVASLEVLPLPTVLALVFASPLVVGSLSGPFLGERVGPVRWAAILVGFVGILIILQPGSPQFEYLLLLPVAAALSSGTRDLITRWASRTDSTLSILFWSNVAVVSVGLCIVPFQWVDVQPIHYAAFLVVALLNTAAHFLMIYALSVGDAALVSPFRYTALVWAVIIGYLVWDHVPEIWTIIGSSIVVASGIVMALREARAARIKSGQ